MFLESISSRFVQHVHPAQIRVDGLFVQFTEANVGYLVKLHLLARGPSQQMHTRCHLVNTTGKFAQHGARLVRITGLSEGASIEPDKCVGADYQVVGMAHGNFQRLGPGVGHNKSSEAERVVRDFVGRGWHDQTIQAGGLQKLASSR